MMKHAWHSYVNYAWGHNELRSQAKTFYDGNKLGQAPLGATIVDSIDTLYIMGLEKEYMQAAKWIKTNFDFYNNVSRIIKFLSYTYKITNSIAYFRTPMLWGFI